MADFMHLSSTWPKRRSGDKPVVGTWWIFTLYCDKQHYRLRLFHQVMLLEFQQEFPLQSGTGSLPEISDISTALSLFFVAMLLCCFMDVPWIQGSHLSIENAVKAQPLSHDPFSRGNVCVHSQICTDCGAQCRSLDLILSLGNERQILGWWW